MTPTQNPGTLLVTKPNGLVEEIPPEAKPESPWGLSRWESRTFVGAVIGLTGTLVALGTKGLMFFGIVDRPISFDQASITEFIVVAAELIGMLAGVGGAGVAAQGRLNNGKALSPLK